MQVKVCGLRSVACARACTAAGVDFAGLNFVWGARRSITLAEAEELIPELGAVIPVGVFQDSSASDVQLMARAAGLTWVQLHGEEPPEDCAALRERGLRVIKAMDLHGALNPRTLDRYLPHIDVLLVDGRVPGSGRRWEWSSVGTLRPRLQGVPLWLAGGLTPENVEGAALSARPRGVDVATGVERDKRIDPERVRAFTRNARLAGELVADIARRPATPTVRSLVNRTSQDPDA